MTVFVIKWSVHKREERWFQGFCSKLSGAKCEKIMSNLAKRNKLTIDLRRYNFDDVHSQKNNHRWQSTKQKHMTHSCYRSERLMPNPRLIRQVLHSYTCKTHAYGDIVALIYDSGANCSLTSLPASKEELLLMVNIDMRLSRLAEHMKLPMQLYD